jgi:hypothetical protein
VVFLTAHHSCVQLRELRSAASIHMLAKGTNVSAHADVVQIVKAKIKHGDEGRGRFSTVKKDKRDKKPLKS